MALKTVLTQLLLPKLNKSRVLREMGLFGLVDPSKLIAISLDDETTIASIF